MLFSLGVAASVALAAAGALAIRRRILASEALWEAPGTDFMAFQQHLAGETGLAVNPEATVLCLARVGRAPRFLAPEQLLGVEVIEDGAVVLRRDRAAGWDRWERDRDVCARHERVTALSLRITVDDPAGRVHEVSFLSRAASKDSAAYRDAAASALHWYRVVERLLQGPRAAARAPMLL